MSEYYIGALAFSDFNAISHGRPKGSRNGYTTMLNYKPIGKPAKGKYDPRRGYYIYDNAAGGGRGKSSDFVRKSQLSYAHRISAAKAREANLKYKRSLRGRIDSAYDSARTFAKSAYGSARKSAGSAYDSTRRGVGSAYRSAVSYLTGSNARLGMERARDERSIERARAQYLNKTLPGQIEKAYGTVSRYAKTTYKTVSEAVSVYKQRAQKAITQAYSKAANWVNSTAPKVRKKVQQAIGVVRSCYNTAVSKVSEFGREAVNKVKGLFEGLFNKKSKKKSGGQLATGIKAEFDHLPPKSAKPKIMASKPKIVANGWNAEFDRFR